MSHFKIWNSGHPAGRYLSMQVIGRCCFDANSIILSIFTVQNTKKMKTKIILLSCLLLLCSVNMLHAQWGFGKVEEIEEMKSRKLVIMTQDENEKVIEKLQKKGYSDKIDDYKQSLDEYNKVMEESVLNIWPFHEEAELKTYDQLRELAKNKSEKYVVIYVVNVDVTQTYMNGKYETHYDIDYKLDWTYRDAKNDDYDKAEKGSGNEFSMLRVALIEDFLKTPIAQVSLPNKFPTKSDIAFGLDYCTWYMNQRLNDQKAKDMRDILKDNPKKIPDYTLAICADDLSSKVPESKVKLVYPNPHEVVTREEMDNIILNRSEGYAYLVVLFGTAVIADAKTGEMLDVADGFGGGSNLLLTEKDFERILKDIEKASK